MHNAPADYSKSRRAAKADGIAWRAIAGFLIACTIFLQSYIVQTHIHGLPGTEHSALDLTSAAAPAGLTVQAGEPDKKHAPAQDDPENCPLCQAVFHANAVLFSPSLAVAPSMALFGIDLPVFERIFSAPYRGHDQEQRGPPGF